jgi:hypothetical protein
MAIVNNPHNIQDIDKQYKTWVKLAKFKAILISATNDWFLSKSSYFAREWLSSTSENNPNKADQKKQQMLNAIKSNTTFINSLDFTNSGNVKPVFSKTDDKDYYFQFHFFTVDEISKNAYPNNPDKNLLMNNGLFELRILDGNSQNSNIIYSTKVCCNDNSSGQRNNDMNNEILPEKFILTYITPDKTVNMIESDRIYPLDSLYFIYGYGLQGEFVNTYTVKEGDAVIPDPTRIRSLYDDGFTDGGEGTFTSTDLLRCKNTWDETAYPYYFTDVTKQRNGLFIDSRYDNGSRRKWFSEKTGSTFPEQTLRDFTLFKDFKLNTEFTNEIRGDFYHNFNDKIESIDCDTLRFDNCKKVTELFAGLTKLKTIKNFKFNGVKPDNILELNTLYSNTLLTSIDWSEFPSFRNSKKWIGTFNGSDNDWVPNNTVTEIKLQKDFGRNNKNIESFKAVFKNNGKLTTIENLDLNMPKCTSFKELFRFCTNLKTVNLNNIHSEKPVDCNSMFFNCTSLANETLDITGIENFYDISYMFSSARNVKTVKFKKGALNFTGKQYINWEFGPLNSVFNEMQSVETIENLEDLELPGIISIRELFRNTRKLKSINLPNLNLNAVENTSYTFCNSGAKSISISNTEKINNIKTMEFMFNGSWYLKQLDFPPLTRKNNKQNTTNLTNIAYLFNDCGSISVPIYVDNLNTSNVTNMEAAFSFSDNIFNDKSNEKDLRGLENLDTRNVTNMRYLFRNTLFKNKELDLSRWDVSKVTTLFFAFNFTNLKKINISGWNVSKVKTMRFSFCGTDIKSISDIIGFDSLNFSTDLELLAFNGIFSACRNLVTGILPDSFKNINKELSLSDMFSNCDNLTNIDMRDSKFTIIEMNEFARACSRLETVNFGNTKIKVHSGEDAFSRCSSLRQINGIIELDDSFKIISGGIHNGMRNTHYRYKDEEHKATIENMFLGCDNLRGLKIKNIPGGNLDVFEDITKLKRNQYTVVS